MTAPDTDQGAERPVGCVPAVLTGPVEARMGDRRRPPGRGPADRRPPGRRDRGSVTAELAAALPALMLLLVAGVTAVAVTGVKIRCVSAARDGALGEARGEGGAGAARRSAPDGASVSVSVDGDLARATVSARVRPLGGLLPAITVDATAVAAMEPGTP
jgi:hypothetical protein